MSWFRYGVAWLLPCAFVLVGSGCVSQQVRVKPPVYPIERVVNAADSVPVVGDSGATPSETGVGSKPVAGALDRFGIERVARRLSVYEGWLYRWRAVTNQYEAKEKPLPDDWYGCMQRVEIIYEGYGRFRRGIVVGGDAATDGNGSWEVVGADFDYQESGCIDLFQAQVNKTSVKKGTVVDVESLGQAVCEAVRKGKYQEALDAYGEIERIGHPVSVAVRQAYAVAQLRTNKVDIALTELQKILDENGVFDSWTVRRQVADLLLVTGKHEEAMKKFLRASELYEKAKNSFDASYALFKAAECNYILKNYSTATERFLKAADLAFKVGYDRFGLSALEYALDCYKATGAKEKAKELKKKIKEVKEKLSAF